MIFVGIFFIFLIFYSFFVLYLRSFVKRFGYLGGGGYGALRLYYLFMVIISIGTICLLLSVR